MVAALLLAAQAVTAVEARFTVPTVAGLLEAQDAAGLTAWGLRYAHGEGVGRDVTAAVRLLCKAARGGHAPAQYELGVMYMHGRGVARDDAQAAAWLGLAAAQDSHAAGLLSYVAATDGEAAEPRCLLPDGSEHLPPLKSVPDPSPELILAWVERLAPDYDLDPALVAAVIRTESNFDPRARSPKNALGLMQLIPATARRFGVEDVWDPLQNLKGGLAYLRWLVDHFEGDLELALAGYNAGENAVKRYRGIPPYPETRRYVSLVKQRLAAGYL